MIRDLDGDKIGDVTGEQRPIPRIDVFLSSKRPAERGRVFGPSAKKPMIWSSKRMRLASVPVNKEVVSLGTGDFNGDGKPDLVSTVPPPSGRSCSTRVAAALEAAKRSAAETQLKPPGHLPSATSTATAVMTSRCWPRTTYLRLPDLASGVLSEPERMPHTEPPMLGCLTWMATEPSTW